MWPFLASLILVTRYTTLLDLISPSKLKAEEIMGEFWTFLSHLQTVAGPVVMLLYPLYASVQATESPSKLDDEQWLAYWILYSFLTLMEMVLEPVLYWIPIWPHMKLVLVAWMVLPQFRGAAFIYERFVREQLIKKHGAKIGMKHGEIKKEH